MTQTLPDQVEAAASLLGLLLALVTLFTSEQAKRLEDERSLEGGARRNRMSSIRYSCIGLGVVTFGSVALLGPLVIDVVKAVGGDEWQPVLGVFALAYLLLCALLFWQVALAFKSAK